MSLAFTHKPNYFLFAQLIIRHIENYVQKHPDVDHAVFDLRDVHELFRQDLASATTNLDGIMNIADEYVVETVEGDQKIIQRYEIDPTEHRLLINFNPLALHALQAGKPIIPPDATMYQ